MNALTWEQVTVLVTFLLVLYWIVAKGFDTYTTFETSRLKFNKLEDSITILQAKTTVNKDQITELYNRGVKK